LEVLTGIRQQGVTVLLIEQDVFAALSVVDRACVMKTGQIVQEATPSELTQNENVRRAYPGELTT
jgi:branched-chain amino acid transport system ATP-binding protein